MSDGAPLNGDWRTCIIIFHSSFRLKNLQKKSDLNTAEKPKELSDDHLEKYAFLLSFIMDTCQRNVGD